MADPSAFFFTSRIPVIEEVWRQSYSLRGVLLLRYH